MRDMRDTSDKPPIYECHKPDGGFRAWSIVAVSFSLSIIEVRFDFVE